MQDRPRRQQDMTGKVREGKVVVFNVISSDLVTQRSEGWLDLAIVIISVSRDDIDASLQCRLLHPLHSIAQIAHIPRKAAHLNIGIPLP